MSIDIMNRVWWRDDLPTMEKFVALALADTANDDDGVCWPAVATIARKCSCSTRTVQNAIRGLCGKGLLRTRQRKDRSTIYIFVLANLPMVDRQRRQKEIGPHESHLTGAGDSPDLFERGESGSGTGESSTGTGAGDSPRTLIEPSLNHQRTLSDDEIVNDFNRRWKELAADIAVIGDIAKFSDTRKGHLLARIDEHGVPEMGGRSAAQVTDLFDRVFGLIRGSRYLCGEIKSWHVSVDWLLNKTNFNKVMEFNYVQDRNPNYQAPADDRREERSHLEAGQAALEMLRSRRERPASAPRELAR